MEIKSNPMDNNVFDCAIYNSFNFIFADIKNLKSELITIDPDAVQSNMLLLCFPSDRLTSEQFVERMAEVILLTLFLFLVNLIVCFKL